MSVGVCLCTSRIIVVLLFDIYHHLLFTILLLTHFFCCSCSFLVSFALLHLLVAMFFTTLFSSSLYFDLMHLSQESAGNIQSLPTLVAMFFFLHWNYIGHIVVVVNLESTWRQRKTAPQKHLAI